MLTRAVAAAAIAAGIAAPVGPAVADDPRDRPGESRAGCGSGLVSLTFDDGPVSSVTPRMVRTLGRFDVPATFFMVGSRVAASPGIARQVERAGFLVANHSYHHEDMRTQSAAQIRATIRRTDRALRRAGTHPIRLVRPPYGGVDSHVSDVIRDAHQAMVLWDVDPRDWAGGSGADIAARVLAGLRPHGRNIVLLHDGVANSPRTVEAVPRIVRTARRRGYCFVALDEQGRPGFPTPTATLRLAPGDGRVREGGTLRATVALDQPAGRATSVRLVLRGGTASPSKDLDRPDPVLAIPAGRLSATVAIPVLRDALDEPNERFELRLARPAGVRVDDAARTAIVEDADPPPRISGEPRGVVEPADGWIGVPVVFRLDRPSAKDVRLSAQTVAGTADGSDFTPLSTRLTIPAGNRKAVITVQVLADDVDEAAESFKVHLTSARNARIRIPDAVVTINPPPP